MGQYKDLESLREWREEEGEHEPARAPRVSPGKRTLTMRLPRRSPEAQPFAPPVQRRGAAIYRKASHDAGDRDHPAVLAALAKRGSGAPLSEEVRRSMEA